MPGPPVTIGCAVVLSPGVSGPPDSGFISVVQQTTATASGMPLATMGSVCQMINSFTGAPYTLPIASGGSAGVTIAGSALLRMGDMIPAGPGILTLLGPPAAPFVTDQGAP
jgi:hypothetical protein